MTAEEFQQLINKYLEGTATKAEQAFIDHFFQSYEKKETGNEVPPDGSAEMWLAIQSKTIQRKEPQKLKAPLKKAISTYHKRWVKVLSFSVAFFMLLGAGLFIASQQGFLGPSQTAWKTLAVEAGQKSILTLPDGSLAHLNSGSTISYPKGFAADKRELVLKGEAFFEVVKDKKRPFIVRSGAVNTTVLGTSFNIQAYQQKQISVTVATGRVEVAAVAGNGESSGPDTAVASAVLSPGQQAVYDPAQKSLTTALVDIARYTAWRENILHFENATLEEAGEKLGRWYGVELQFKNEKIRQCRISGQFKEQSLENVLESFEYMYGIKYQYIQKNKIQLYGKGCE